jgi:hypothetical protein
MRKFKYSDLLADLEGFDPWLLNLGLKVIKNDRIHQAFAVLRMAEEASRNGRETGQYSAVRGEHLFPLIEALEAYEIFMAYRADSSSVLSSSLKRALSGPVQPSMENERNRDGRNIWFELVLAAEWKLRGAQVHLGEPDLRLVHNNTRFLIACKRPAREESVRANIRAAISQLNENLKSAPKDTFGVVSISLSYVLNNGTKYWTGEIEQLGDLLHQQMVRYRSVWQSAEADSRICAILFHAATPSDLGKDVDLSLATYAVASPLIGYSDGSRLFGEHLKKMKTSTVLVDQAS